MTQSLPSRIDHDTKPYWDGLAEGVLRLARCAHCAHWIHPPRACCPECWSDTIITAEPSGKATLYSYLVQPVVPGGPPTVVGWAELVEQERLLVVAPIEGVDASSVAIGSQLTLHWLQTDGVFTPVFHQEA